jgi:ABC-type sugar transport system ATPase subunit
MATVGLQDVWKRYGKVEAVKGISMEIVDGEFVALLGPSGCGKTSTMRMIAGLEEISAGDIRFDGKSVIDRPPRARNVAMAFENYALYPTLSVYENLAFPARAAHWANDRIDKRVREVAAIAAIDKLLDRRTGELSSGQAQMVGLARALVREPAVFLLDEPISHVDARLRIDMRTYIKRLQVELGYTMVLVTHDQEDAMALADRIAVMADGRLRQLGTPADVYDRPEDTFVANFIGSPPINLFECQIEQSGRKTVLRRDGLTFDLPDQFLPLAAAGTLPASVTVGIRPFHLTAGAGAGHGAIAARVVVVEPLGDMEIVTAEAANLPIQVVIPPGNRPKRDDTMQLALDPEYVLIFDPESQQAIHAPSDGSATARAAAALN